MGEAGKREQTAILLAARVKHRKSISRSFFASQPQMKKFATQATYLSNTLTNLCIALYCILLYCVVLNCIVLLIYCYMDLIQYNATHKFVVFNKYLDFSRPKFYEMVWLFAFSKVRTVRKYHKLIFPHQFSRTRTVIRNFPSILIFPSAFLNPNFSICSFQSAFFIRHPLAIAPLFTETPVKIYERRSR